MALTVTTDRVAELFKAVDDLQKSKVLVGIPDTSANRQPEEGEKGAPISNALIGYLMENGAPEINLLARPTLVPGVEKAMPQIIPRLEKAALAAVNGDATGVEASLMAAGIIGSNAVKAEITDGTFAPLSERTIKARLRRGRTSTKPLIDTAQFRNSVTYVVVRRGS